MRLGLTLPMWGPTTSDLTAEVVLNAASDIEAAGFDAIWIPDVLNRGYASLDPLIAAAMAGSVTSSIEIGTAVLQVGRYQPIDLAHRVMSTVLACEGRFTLGAGAGSTRRDFDAVGANFVQRFQALETNLSALRLLMAGAEFEGINLHPWPSVIGQPPIVIGSWSSGMWIPRAAQDFDGWIGSTAKTSFAALVASLAIYRKAGGMRAIAGNLQVDLDAQAASLSSDSPLDLRCPASEASRRLIAVRDAGFDEVTLTIFDHSKQMLETLRNLL